MFRKNILVCFNQFYSGPKVTTKKRMKPIYDSVDEEDEDVSESDVEEENNENEMQRERIRSYDISEFVHQPHSCAVFIEAPSIESLQSTVTSVSFLTISSLGVHFVCYETVESQSKLSDII